MFHFLVDVKDLVNHVFMEVLLMFTGPQNSKAQESLWKNNHRESKYVESYSFITVF